MKVYDYSGCSTCKKALKFLRSHGVEYEQFSIVDCPPSKAELQSMLKILRSRGGGLKNLFNTSGLQYRELKIAERLKAGMTDSEALDLMAADGKLIKRPFLLTTNSGAVGFNESEWEKLL